MSSWWWHEYVKMCRSIDYIDTVVIYTRVSQMKTLNNFYFLSWTIWCADPWLISICVAISFIVTWRFSFTMASTAAMASGVTTRCAWSGRGESVTELILFMNFLGHTYTCCSDRHASPYWTSIRQQISMGFTPSLQKMDDRTLFFFGACLSQAAIFSLLQCHHVAFLNRTATC